MSKDLGDVPSGPGLSPSVGASIPIAWQYTYVHSPLSAWPKEEIDALGRKGWEMFHIEMSAQWYRYFFRRPILAQGIEAEGRDAQRLGAKPESPVAEGDAP